MIQILLPAQSRANLCQVVWGLVEPSSDYLQRQRFHTTQATCLTTFTGTFFFVSNQNFLCSIFCQLSFFLSLGMFKKSMTASSLYFLLGCCRCQRFLFLTSSPTLKPFCKTEQTQFLSFSSNIMCFILPLIIVVSPRWTCSIVSACTFHTGKP